MRLLLIEDDVELASMLVSVLGKNGLLVDHTTLIGDGLELARQNTYNTILLNHRLPDGDGLSFVESFRRDGGTTPILVLTARNTPQERVKGLNLGADDYLGKPFLMDELIARVRALLRRPVTVVEQKLAAGSMIIDPLHMTVHVGPEQIDIPRRELLLLVALAKRINKTVGRDTLEAAVYNYEDEIQSNALDAHVSRLRKRLGDAEAGVSIHSIRGVGYLLKRDA